MLDFRDPERERERERDSCRCCATDEEKERAVQRERLPGLGKATVTCRSETPNASLRGFLLSPVSALPLCDLPRVSEPTPTYLYSLIFQKLSGSTSLFLNYHPDLSLYQYRIPLFPINSTVSLPTALATTVLQCPALETSKTAPRVARKRKAEDPEVCLPTPPLLLPKITSAFANLPSRYCL